MWEAYDSAPAFQLNGIPKNLIDLRRQLGEAFQAWLTRSPSIETREG